MGEAQALRRNLLQILQTHGVDLTSQVTERLGAAGPQQLEQWRLAAAVGETDLGALMNGYGPAANAVGKNGTS
jgi:hypothetical protein